MLVLALLGCVSENRILRAASQVDLGVAYYQEGNLESSVAALEQAHRLDPRNWRALNALSIAYLSKGDEARAKTVLDAAVRMNPTEAEVLVNLGAWQVRHGEAKAAVETFQTALKDLDYRNPALVLSNLSRAYLDDGRTDAAIASAREAIRRTPALCEAHFHLGLALEQKGADEDALAVYRQQEAACPGEGMGARLREGCILARLGRADEARMLLADVQGAHPNTAMSDQARACLATLSGS